MFEISKVSVTDLDQSWEWWECSNKIGRGKEKGEDLDWERSYGQKECLKGQNGLLSAFLTLAFFFLFPCPSLSCYSFQCLMSEKGELFQTCQTFCTPAKIPPFSLRLSKIQTRLGTLHPFDLWICINESKDIITVWLCNCVRYKETYKGVAISITF